MIYDWVYSIDATALLIFVYKSFRTGEGMTMELDRQDVQPFL